MEMTRKEQIVDRYLAGESIGALAAGFGVSRQRIHQIKNAAGAQRDRVTEYGPTQVVLARITEVLSGASPSEAAKSLGVNIRAVRTSLNWWRGKMEIPLFSDARLGPRATTTSYIIEARERGESYGLIARTIGVTTPSIYSAIKRHRPDLMGQPWGASLPRNGTPNHGPKRDRTGHSAKRRGRKFGALGWFNTTDILVIAKRQKHVCAACPIKIMRKTWHIDHIKPLALGGSNFPRNIQLLCAPCNMAKGRKHPADFARERGLLL